MFKLAEDKFTKSRFFHSQRGYLFLESYILSLSFLNSRLNRCQFRFHRDFLVVLYTKCKQMRAMGQTMANC